jgi:hypothetical protein
MCSIASSTFIKVKSPPKPSKEKSPPKTSKAKSPPKASKEKSPPKASKEKSSPKTSKAKSPPKALKEKSLPKTSKAKSPPKALKDKSPPKVSKAKTPQPLKENPPPRATKAKSPQPSKDKSSPRASKAKSHKRKLSEATASTKASAGKAAKVGNPKKKSTQQSPPQNRLSYEPVILQQVHNEISEASRDAFDSPGDEVICIQCGETPCDWLRFGVELLSEAKSTYPCVLGDRSSHSA